MVMLYVIEAEFKLKCNQDHSMEAPTKRRQPEIAAADRGLEGPEVKRPKAAASNASNASKETNNNLGDDDAEDREVIPLPFSFYYTISFVLLLFCLFFILFYHHVCLTGV